MEEAGLRVREDEAANIIGRLDPKEGPADGPCIATGSHIDAVPHGGKFDGALGVCASLEALRAIRESGLPIPCPLELLVFTDEEGGHYAGTFGSRAMFNLLAQGEIDKSKGPGQSSMAQDLKRMGKDFEKIDRAIRGPSEFHAFLELHIEQGPILESRGVPIGIVEGIVYLHRYLIQVDGRAGHAGTIPMNQRDDALVKAAQVVTGVNRVVSSAGPNTVGTIGELKVFPGAFNIIPGRVEMTLDLRSMKEKIITSVREEIEKVVRSVDKARIQPILTKSGVRMNPAIMEMLELSCRERRVRFHRLGSGAGHDTMTFPTVGVPAGMIFIPCREGK
ncbi:MAG: hydantoinase/carbamoylase family amidase, partial [Deltaproteobacteria bacterium]|nr:hydantoinase/carbamoylase family amidase [Deltaproteobacteria bacterium]